MFSEDEKKFIENLFYSSLKTYDSYLESLNIKLWIYETYLSSFKYTKKKFLFILSYLAYIMFVLIYLQFNIYNSVLLFPFLFIFCLTSVFIILILNRIKKDIGYFNRLGNYKFYRKKLWSIKKRIDIIFSFNRTKEFNRFSEYNEYYKDINQKLHNYTSVFRKDDSFLKFRITGIWELIISTFLSFFGLFIYFLIAIANGYYFPVDIFVIFFPIILILFNQLNPFLYDQEGRFDNEIQKELEVLMDIYEKDRFPSEQIQQKLINHIFCGFKNFQYNVLCPKCSDIFAITILSDIINCPSCNNVIKNDNLIIKVNSFDLEFFCIKCGFLNEPTINNPFAIEYSCKKCEFQQGKYDFRFFLPVIERLTYHNKTTGFLFSITFSDDELYLITYFNDNNYNPVIKLYSEDDELKLMNHPLNQVKKLFKSRVNIRNILTKGIKSQKFTLDTLKKYKKVSQDEKESVINRIKVKFPNCYFELNKQLNELNFWNKNKELPPSGLLWLKIISKFFGLLRVSTKDKKIFREQAQSWNNEPKDMALWTNDWLEGKFGIKHNIQSRISDGHSDHFVDDIALEDKLLRTTEKLNNKEIIKEKYEKESRQVKREGILSGFQILIIGDIRNEIKDNSIVAKKVPECFKIFYEDGYWTATFLFQAFTDSPSNLKK